MIERQLLGNRVPCNISLWKSLFLVQGQSSKNKYTVSEKVCSLKILKVPLCCSVTLLGGKRIGTKRLL